MAATERWNLRQLVSALPGLFVLCTFSILGTVDDGHLFYINNLAIKFET